MARMIRFMPNHPLARGRGLGAPRNGVGDLNLGLGGRIDGGDRGDIEEAPHIADVEPFPEGPERDLLVAVGEGAAIDEGRQGVSGLKTENKTTNLNIKNYIQAVSEEEAIGRNPEAADKINSLVFVLMAICESTGIYSLVLALIMIFA